MKKLTPLKAIRANCLECSAGNHAEVRRCDMVECPLFIYRFGKRLATIRKMELARRKRDTKGREL